MGRGRPPGEGPKPGQSVEGVKISEGQLGSGLENCSDVGSLVG